MCLVLRGWNTSPQTDMTNMDMKVKQNTVRHRERSVAIPLFEAQSGDCDDLPISIWSPNNDDLITNKAMNLSQQENQQS